MLHPTRLLPPLFLSLALLLTAVAEEKLPMPPKDDSLLATVIENPPLYSFTARVGDVRLKNRLIEQGKEPDDYVGINLHANVYKETETFDLNSEPTDSKATPMDAFKNYQRYYHQVKLDKLANFWHKDSRKEIESMLEDESITEWIRKQQGQVQSIDIMGIVWFGETAGIVHRVQGHTLVATLKKSDGQWLLSNDEPNELNVAIVEAAFSNGNVHPAE